MKKLLAILMSLTVMVGFTACSNSDSTSDSGSKSENSASNDDNSESSESEKAPAADESPITVDDVLNHPETPAEDFEYRDGDFVVIEGYKGTDSIVVVPEQINGHPVTVINGNGFNLNSKVKGVSLPSGVTELSGTFNGNEVLQIVVAKGIKKAGEYTFIGNPCLKYVDLGPNLTELFGNQFICNEELKIRIPSCTTEINCCYMWEETTTIIGEAGSYAETYANERGIKFEAE